MRTIIVVVHPDGSPDSRVEGTSIAEAMSCIQWVPPGASLWTYRVTKLGHQQPGKELPWPKTDHARLRVRR
jgi:hypothetical protein